MFRQFGGSPQKEEPRGAKSAVAELFGRAGTPPKMRNKLRVRGRGIRRETVRFARAFAGGGRFAFFYGVFRSPPQFS